MECFGVELQTEEVEAAEDRTHIKQFLQKMVELEKYFKKLCLILNLND